MCKQTTHRTHCPTERERECNESNPLRLSWSFTFFYCLPRFIVKFLLSYTILFTLEYQIESSTSSHSSLFSSLSPLFCEEMSYGIWDMETLEILSIERSSSSERRKMFTWFTVDSLRCRLIEIRNPEGYTGAKDRRKSERDILISHKVVISWGGCAANVSKFEDDSELSGAKLWWSSVVCLVCHAILRSHCVAGGDARDKFRQISDCAKKYSKDQKEKYTQHMKLKNIVQSNENTLNDRATTTNTFMKVVKFYGFHHSEISHYINFSSKETLTRLN